MSPAFFLKLEFPLIQSILLLYPLPPCRNFRRFLLQGATFVLVDL